MGLIRKFILLILTFARCLLIALAVGYIATWCCGIFDLESYNFANKYLHKIPDIVDNIFPITRDIWGDEVSMGYIICALICAILAIILIKYCNIEENNIRMDDIKREESKFYCPKKPQKVKLAKENTKKETGGILFFACLLELKLEYFQKNDASDIGLEKLKTEYTNMLTRKLQEKYKNIKFISKDKVFFICWNFSFLESLVLDIKRIFDIFLQINNKENIKTDIIVSFYTDKKNPSPKKALKMLTKINGLNLINKFITNEEVKDNYIKNINTLFDFIPLGTSKFLNEEDEEEIDLYYLKKKI